MTATWTYDIETDHTAYGLQTILSEETGRSHGVGQGGRLGTEARVRVTGAELGSVKARLRAGGHAVYTRPTGPARA
jgi:hypothetical protein